MPIESLSSFAVQGVVGGVTSQDECVISEGYEGKKRSLATRLQELLLWSKSREFSKIGVTDDRGIQIRTEQYPWRTICALEIQFGDVVTHGTGWLAGPRTVITAGHCLYDHDHSGGWAQRVQVVPGRSSLSNAPFGAFVSTRLSCTKAWQDSREKWSDLGCIHLETDIGLDLGWIGFAPPDWGEEDEVEVTVSGYSIFDSEYKDMLFGTGQVRAMESGLLFYAADTDEGQSGSPVWIHSQAATVRKVVATHAYRKEDLERGRQLDGNAGVVTTSEVQDLFIRWNQLSQQP